MTHRPALPSDAVLGRRLKSIVVAMAAGPLILLAFIVYIVYLVASSDFCGNTIIAQTVSPDRAHRAVVFVRSCGATTGNSTQVSVLGLDVPLGHAGGNVLAIDANHGTAPAGEGGGPVVHADWASPNELRLTYHSQARRFLQASSWDAVKIVHRQSADVE